ncbi:MAG: hypothetical protein WC180_05435 [Candidatus Paceibacterota bacterium]
MTTLEKTDGNRLNLLPLNAILKSEQEDMIAIKKDLYWEILSRAEFRGEEGKSRYVGINYNEERMGKFFGPDKHDYWNYLSPRDTAGKHFHLETREIFFAPYLEHSLIIKLKHPETGEQAEVAIDAQLVEFEGKKWLKAIMIPEGIAHAVHNPNQVFVPLLATTTNEHGTQDVFACEM